MHQSSQPDLLIPIETAIRELDAKLLLALFAAEAGFRCHIGPMHKIISSRFRKSIYLSKSVRFAKQVKLMKQLGHTIVAWDEEGLVRFNDDIHAARLEPDALDVPELLFSWGRSNTRVWKKHPFYKGTKIVESGNPRIDLLRPELRTLYRNKVDELRTKHGQFVLFNTNFSFVNHFKAGGRPPKVSQNSLDAGAFLAFRREVDRHKARLLQEFKVLVPRLAAGIAPFKLIIRPHPSENQAMWREVAAAATNVAVLQEGPVAPWLMAASCLVHNGCTSAVEAAVLNLPTFAFCPVEDERYDFVLPNSLSEKFKSSEALVERIKKAFVEARPPDGTKVTSSEVLSDNISALDGPFSSERIVAALADVQQSSAGAAQLVMSQLARLKLATRLIKRLMDSESRTYANQKAMESNFTPERISAQAAEFGKVLGRFKGLEFSKLIEGIVTIAPQKQSTVRAC
jgi:surface carbohydrate biosynthesis protein